jgi:hypothetical protein
MHASCFDPHNDPFPPPTHKRAVFRESCRSRGMPSRAQSSPVTYALKASYLEIYNERPYVDTTSALTWDFHPLLRSFGFSALVCDYSEWRRLSQHHHTNHCANLFVFFCIKPSPHGFSVSSIHSQKSFQIRLARAGQCQPEHSRGHEKGRLLRKPARAAGRLRHACGQMRVDNSHHQLRIVQSSCIFIHTKKIPSSINFVFTSLNKIFGKSVRSTSPILNAPLFSRCTSAHRVARPQPPTHSSWPSLARRTDASRRRR